MPWCNDCGEHTIFPESHRCPPIWRVHCADYHGDDPKDGHEIRACDAQAAAEKWAQIYDSDGDYTIINGSHVEVSVYDAEKMGLFPKRFRLFGEMVPEYWAENAKMEQKPE